MGLNKQGKDSLAGHQSSSEETDDKSKEQQLKGGDSGSATDGTVTAADESTGVKCSNDIHERPLDPDKLPDDFFEVLFACNDAKIPWRSLLAHAIALHRPLFAVLAACYEESKTIDCICAWMLSTYDFELFSSEVANDIS
ncbi:uncharacterized protein LOC110246681, partial [Exaiptasia diaphana]|uniref:Uncharacterized protein n=1 Tax=Exaiptasia diaphana TaxID=2652724 RepID=A0A913XRU3_EXADI